MNLKEAIGYSLYRGSLAKPSSHVARILLRAGVLKDDNVWRATALVIENLHPSPEELLSIWKKLPEHFDKKFFVLHIMKTAGTSVKLSAARAIQLYDLTGWSLRERLGEIIPADTLDKYSYWPFMSGHLHVDSFPTDFTGITIFREPRARFLSHYRQEQRLSSFAKKGLVQDLETPSVFKNIPLEVYSHNFWRHDCVWQFTSGHIHDFRHFLTNAHEDEIMESLELALDRIQIAGWTHDLDTFYRDFSTFLGKDLKPEKRNTYPEQIQDEEFKLTKDDLMFIQEITKREKQLQASAASRGLIASLSQSQADALFEQTAKRLNFHLP